MTPPVLCFTVVDTCEMAGDMVTATGKLEEEKVRLGLEGKEELRDKEGEAGSMGREEEAEEAVLVCAREAVVRGRSVFEEEVRLDPVAAVCARVCK